jgi:PIN domain nuclease of toxin-antitoxin system
VVDTNALIWYLTSDRKLGTQARQVFEAAERGETRLVLSAIAIAELYYANKKNGWFPDFQHMYQQLRSKPQFRLIPFTADQVADFDADSAVPEMHDRIIAGLARRLGAPLITADPLIASANVVQIVW